MSREKIVVLSLTRMGDLIQSTPLLRALRKQHPRANIALIVLNRFVDTGRRLPMVDEVVGFDVDRFVGGLDRSAPMTDASSALRELLSTESVIEPDLLINLSHTHRSATLTGLLRAKRVLGLYRDEHGDLRLNGEWIAYLLSIMENRSLNPFNLVDIYRRILDDGSDFLATDMQVTAADCERAKCLLEGTGLGWNRATIALQPGASHPSRCWSAARYGNLARELHLLGYQVVVLGDEKEMEIARQVRSESGGIAVTLAGKTDIATLAAILDRAQLLISNDTGTAHIAAAVGTLVLGIFLGPASSKDTAPYGNGHVIVEADAPCAPCDYRKLCPRAFCKDMVTTETVLRVAEHLLSRGKSPLYHDPNCRVYRTAIAADGIQTLLSRTHPQQSRLLEYYRTFWPALLTENGERVSADNRPYSATEFAEGVAWLEAIRASAEESLRGLKHLQARLPLKEPEIRKTLMENTGWQNELRRVVTKNQEVAPLARYLLVHITLARTSHLARYMDDMRSVLDRFDRSLNLLRRSVPQKQVQRHAVQLSS